MAFSINSADLPSIYSCRSARDLFDSIAPLRGYTSDTPRPIGRRTIQNPKTVRMERDGSIVFRLHSTDCVQYHDETSDKPQRLVLRAYPSISTVAFIEALTPANIGISHECRALTLRSAVEDRRRVYNLSGQDVELHYDLDEHEWCLSEENSPAIIPLRRYRVDRKIANAAYKEFKLDDFVAFFSAYCSLKDFGASKPRWRPGLDLDVYRAACEELGYVAYDTPDPLDVLLDQDRARWPIAAVRLAQHTLDAKKARAQLMDAIKVRSDAIVYDEIAYVKDMAEYNKLYRTAKLDNMSCRI